MPIKGAHEKIHAAVTSWPEVAAHPHRFGGTEYRLGKRELGHIHGDALVDLPFPKKARDKIVAAGRAEALNFVIFYCRRFNFFDVIFNAESWA